MARIGLAPYKVNASFTEIRPGVWQGDYDYGKTTSTPTTTTPKVSSPVVTQPTTTVPKTVVGSDGLTDYERAVIKAGSGIVPSTQPSTSGLNLGTTAAKYSSLMNQLNSITNVSDLTNLWSQINYAQQRGEITSAQRQQLYSMYEPKRVQLAQKALNNANTLQQQLYAATTVAEAERVRTMINSAYSQKGIIQSKYVELNHLVDARVDALKVKETAASKSSANALQAPVRYNELLDKMNKFYEMKSVTGLKSMINEINFFQNNGTLSASQASSLMNKLQTMITGLDTSASGPDAKILYDQFKNWFNEIDFNGDPRTALSQLESWKSRLDMNQNSLGSYYGTLLNLYNSYKLNLDSKLEQQSSTTLQSKFDQIWSVIQNATSLNGLAPVPGMIAASGLSIPQQQQLYTYLEQRKLFFSTETMADTGGTEITIPLDVPTVSEIMSASSQSVLDAYQSKIARYYTDGKLPASQFQVLSSAISVRESQLDQASAATQLPSYPTYPTQPEPSRDISVVVAAPASLPQAPVSAPVIVSQPSAPSSPIIISQQPPSYYPSQGSGVPVTQQPSQGGGFDLAAPNEGPPLPKSWGIRWPSFLTGGKA